MSAKKFESSANFENQVTIQGRQTHLSLSEDAVVIHKGGIEFHSPASFAPWTEMTVTLRSPKDGGKVNCAGVVISCCGSKHSGYSVSMIFTSLTRQAQMRLNTMAESSLG